MKVEKAGSHIDHLLRQTRMHHVQLSSMADMKASILLTMSSVVLTLSMRYITDETLRWACLTLIAFCLLTITLATFAVMPHLPYRLKPGPHGDVRGPRFNLLFFGDFARLDYDEFVEAFEQVVASPEQTYEAQVREIYTLGLFLATKKYRFLRLSYLTFIIGFLASGALILIGEVLREMGG